MDEQDKEIHHELERSKAELLTLYEISNAMRKTLELDQVLFIILTGVTSHDGLGFNRAALFLANEHDNTLDGKMAIGPDTPAEAGKIWSQIERERWTLEYLTSAYDVWSKRIDSKLNGLVKSLKIPLREDAGVLALAALEGMTFEITTPEAREKVTDGTIQLFGAENFVVVPLLSKNKTVGVIFADNIFTKEPITKDDTRILMMFANHAGLAIENAQLYEELRIASNTDALTGTWDHGYFQDRLTQMLAERASSKEPLSLLMLDIDNFKYYNDTYGHLTGDKVLRELARAMKKSARADDYVCRYGGEEFAIILPGFKKEEAYNAAERLRAAVEKSANRLTISLGIAAFPQDAKSKNELIAKADSALYEAKRSGKNKTCLYK